MKNKLDLVLIIPFFNEEKIIKKVILSWIKALKKIRFKILLINDGSKDNSSKIVKSIKSDKIILLNKKNSGHGPSVTFGYNHALKLKTDFIFQVDSDNQFYPSNFKYFWKKRKKYDFIIGNRIIRNDPLHRLIITKILKIIILIFFGLYIKDINVPYRLIKSDIISIFVKKINLNNIIPNIFLSLIAFKKFKCTTINIGHKQRSTGKVILVNYKLLNFCIKAVYELFVFRITKF